MAINTNLPSNEDFINLAAFPGFANCVPFQGVSPPEASEASPDSDVAALADDQDDDEDDDGDAVGPRGSKRDVAGGAKRTKASSADRRATHNAIERARRESLNGRFMELASALPTMANVKRPSKSVIVNKSLEWIYESQVREHALVQENQALRAELNEMRTRLSLPPLAAPAPLALASNYGRFKANAAAAVAARQNPALAGLVATQAGLPDSYFAANSGLSVNTLSALHHPSQYPNGFGLQQAGVATPPPSAPANMLAFTHPSAFHHLSATYGASAAHHAQPASPTTKSEPGTDSAGSQDDTSASATSTGVPSLGGSPHSFTPSLQDVASTQAGNFAALHAVHLQHQANLMAAHGQAAGCGWPGPTAGPWGLHDGYSHSGPFVF